MPPITTADSNREAAAASTTASILKERRFKLSRACDRCRRRRIKCDEGHPCQACLTASSACTFEEPGKRTQPTKSKRTATLEDRLHHLESLLSAIPPAVFAANGQNASTNTALTAHSGSSGGSTPSPAIVGVPPPSLNLFPLTNPSTHFRQSFSNNPFTNTSLGNLDSLVESPTDDASLSSPSGGATSGLTPLAPASYFYFDDENYARWQGETSGLALLDLLVERHQPTAAKPEEGSPGSKAGGTATSTLTREWFPSRTSVRTDVNPETLWRLVTSQIAPDLMDSLVQCYLSTSYYILPFLHIPTFLTDYGSPQKWGEPGFAAFIVAICCLASRHINDPRVRADPGDGVSSGTQWFELLHRLRTLPIADRPTLYTIQADLIAGVYAVGLGRLSKAAALLSEAITTSIDAGLHRTSESYDLFTAIEDQVRKRTFWCVYLWDKQLCAHFGRPPMLRVRDCDVDEPAGVDDEFISKDGIGTPPPGVECRMSAFVTSIRMTVILESILDQPARRPTEASPFLSRATSRLFGKQRYTDFRDEEMLLDDIHRSIPTYWAHTPETLASEDTIRVTQATRLHCQENFTRLLLYRGRFARYFAARCASDQSQQQSQAEIDALKSAYDCALAIVSSHMQIAVKGLMTYYGVHVIHQLTQAGRTLVTILLNCQSEALQHQLVNPALEALRSCVGLLRRFSGRYICGQRSGDIMEEFCRLTAIPLEPIGKTESSPIDTNTRPPWIRPAPKKSSSVVPSSSSSTTTKQRSGSIMSNTTTTTDHSSSPVTQYSPFTPIATTQPYSEASFMAGITGAVGMDSTWDLLRTDPSMYLSEEEMLAMFNGANLDVSMFPSPRATGSQPTQPSPLGLSPFHHSMTGSTPGSS